MEKRDGKHSPMLDETNVRRLHERGKRLCYYAELDPYAGRWLPQPFQAAAVAAVRQIKLLSLVFDHVIFPPGYLLKNPAALMVFREMKALFESGVLSVSIGEEFRSDPWRYFKDSMETEGIVQEEAQKPDNRAVREVRGILDGGCYLFRDRSIQIKGFGAEAVQLTHGLLDGEASGARAFSHGVERLVGGHLESSRDDWMALLHHPAHRPSPELSARIGAYINFAYLEQGWLGNLCVMYPSDFLVAHGDGWGFPPAWHAYHAAVIGRVLSDLGIDVERLLRLPPERLLYDILLSSELSCWRARYHEAAETLTLDGSLTASSQAERFALGGEAKGGEAAEELGRRIREVMLRGSGRLAGPMRRAVEHIRRVLRRMPNDAEKALERLAVRGIPGAKVLDLQARMVLGWTVDLERSAAPYRISHVNHSLADAAGREVRFDRAPFLLFLALLQRRGALLEREPAILMMETVGREDAGPILLLQDDWIDRRRKEKPLTYADMDQIVRKLRSGFAAVGLREGIETVRFEGWRLAVPVSHFEFVDLPTAAPLEGRAIRITLDAESRSLVTGKRKASLGPLPFRLLQLLLGYSGAPAGAAVIAAELDLPNFRPNAPISKSVQARIRQYVKIVSSALAATGAGLTIVNDYGVGWRLAIKPCKRKQ